MIITRTEFEAIAEALRQAHPIYNGYDTYTLGKTFADPAFLSTLAYGAVVDAKFNGLSPAASQTILALATRLESGKQ